MNIQNLRNDGALIDQLAEDRVVLLNGANIKPEPIRWIWKDWLAQGKLHILAGAPGQGKTTIALSFAATVTSGGLWPDKSQASAGNVLIWSGEDDPKDTLLPRLLAAGADPSKIYFVEGCSRLGKLDAFDPSVDMRALEAEAFKVGDVKLLIVDPIVSAVSGDSHKNTEVRRALQPLVELGHNLDAAVIGISHFSKGGQGSDPAQRVVGSIAFTAVARVVLVAAKVRSQDGEERKVLARGKSNIGPDDGGFEFELSQSEPITGIKASFVKWKSSLTGSARNLLEESSKDCLGSLGTEAQDFLVLTLSSGSMPVSEIEEKAHGAGITFSAVKRASAQLGILKQKNGFQGSWLWSLPKSHKENKESVSRTL